MFSDYINQLNNGNPTRKSLRDHTAKPPVPKFNRRGSKNRGDNILVNAGLLSLQNIKTPKKS